MTAVLYEFAYQPEIALCKAARSSNRIIRRWAP